MSETQLYRHFNERGDLLYVGISLSAINRLGQHADHAAWFKTISKVTIESFATRNEALDAERNAIHKENPKHNIKHKKEAERLAMEALTMDKAAKAKGDLIKRYVDFRPLYSIQDLAQALTLSTTAVRKAIDNGDLGHVKITSPRGKEHTYVTGWQLIDYVENLERGSK